MEGCIPTAQAKRVTLRQPVKMLDGLGRKIISLLFSDDLDAGPSQWPCCDRGQVTSS